METILNVPGIEAALKTLFSLAVMAGGLIIIVKHMRKENVAKAASAGVVGLIGALVFALGATGMILTIGDSASTWGFGGGTPSAPAAPGR